MTINEIVPLYFRYLELNNKEQSIYKIKNRMNKIIDFFKNKTIEDITKKDIILFKIDLENKNYSYSYKKALYYVLNNCYEFLVLYDYVEVNIVKLIGNFKNKEPKRKYNYWTYEEFKNFIGVCDEQVYKILYTFMFFTGCRLGECLALTFNDLKNNQITINKTITKECYKGKRLITTPKTRNSNREICIDNHLVDELLSLKQIYKEKYSNYTDNFFIFGGIKPLSPTTIERKKNQYCNLANVIKIRLHDFRHSHATLLIQHNIPIIDIANRLGHEDISITLNTYIHSAKDKEKRTINVLNSIRSN